MQLRTHPDKHNKFQLAKQQPHETETLRKFECYSEIQNKKLKKKQVTQHTKKQPHEVYTIMASHQFLLLASIPTGSQS